MSSKGAGAIGQREIERRTWKSARGESVRSHIGAVKLRSTLEEVRAFYRNELGDLVAASFADFQVGPDKRTVSARRVFRVLRWRSLFDWMNFALIPP